MFTRRVLTHVPYFPTVQGGSPCPALAVRSALGSAQRSTHLVTITAALAAELEILTAALDQPGADIAHSVSQLALNAAAAVTTYLGLSVLVSRSEPPFAFTALADGVAADDIRTSLQMVLPDVGDDGDRPMVAVNLYAGSPGAFVDLAADLAWLTARPPSDFVLDQHLTLPTSSDAGTQPLGASVVNQAIGVLIGRGYTPEQADRELDTRAARAGTGRHAVAQLILAKLTPADNDDAD